MTNLETRKTYAVIDNPQNKRLIAKLQTDGENVLIFPRLDTTRTELEANEVDFIGNPSKFAWIIFTDVAAADCFIEAMRESGTDFFELDEVRVCALGEAVADRLRFDQIHSDVIPPNLNDETVFSAISQYAAGEISGASFLVVREKSKNFGFLEMLRKADASIEGLAIYNAAISHAQELTKLKTLLKGGAIDEFIFSSAEDVAALKFFLDGEDLAENLADLKASATTEIAFQTLQENRLRPLYFHHK